MRPGGMGPCDSSFRLITSVDGMRECSLGGGEIREELSAGELPAGVNARDARGPEPEEEEEDGRDRFDRVAPDVNCALEESRRDLAVVDDIGGKGYSYGPEGSVL